MCVYIHVGTYISIGTYIYIYIETERGEITHIFICIYTYTYI